MLCCSTDLNPLQRLKRINQLLKVILQERMKKEDKNKVINEIEIDGKRSMSYIFTGAYFVF